MKSDEQAATRVRDNLRLVLGDEHEEMSDTDTHDPTANDEHSDVDRPGGDACRDGTKHAARHDGGETTMFVIGEAGDEAAPLVGQASATTSKEDDDRDPHKSADGEEGVGSALEGRRIAYGELHILGEGRLAESRGNDRGIVLECAKQSAGCVGLRAD